MTDEKTPAEIAAELITQAVINGVPWNVRSATEKVVRAACLKIIQQAITKATAELQAENERLKAMKASNFEAKLEAVEAVVSAVEAWRDIWKHHWVNVKEPKQNFIDWSKDNLHPNDFSILKAIEEINNSCSIASIPARTPLNGFKARRGESMKLMLEPERW